LFVANFDFGKFSFLIIIVETWDVTERRASSVDSSIGLVFFPYGDWRYVTKI
jgi:hypothetical protein